jgi:hypothetical protein
MWSRCQRQGWSCTPDTGLAKVSQTHHLGFTYCRGYNTASLLKSPLYYATTIMTKLDDTLKYVDVLCGCGKGIDNTPVESW